MTLFTFAAVMGAMFFAVGVLGFTDGVSPPHADDPSLSLQYNYGRLLGLFPINALHNAVHLLIGVAGLLAWRNVWSPVAFAKTIGVLYAILTVMVDASAGGSGRRFVRLDNCRFLSMVAEWSAIRWFA